MESSRRPLEGYRILEVGHILSGPYAGMLLADLGAELIKIETGDGDLSRRVGPHFVGPHNVYFTSLNRNKKSVQIDLTDADGQAKFRRLVASAHGLLVNMRPATIRKLGLDYETLQAVNPKIVCVSLTGFGMTGQASERPAFDYVIQALTGVAALTGDPDGPPTLAGYSAVDNSSGIFAALGMVSKLLQGEGGQVDVSLFDSMLSQLNYKAAAYLNAGESAERLPMGAHLYYVPAQLFATRDGHVAIFITHDEFWARFAREVERPEWLTDAHFASMQARRENRDEVVGALARLFARRDTKHWVDRLSPLGVVVSEVITLPEALDGEIARERDMIIETQTPDGPLRAVASPLRFGSAEKRFEPPPLLGEHSDEILGGGDDE